MHASCLFFKDRLYVNPMVRGESGTRSNSGNDPINGETEENAANTAMNRQSQPIATNDCESHVLEIDSES